MLDFLATFLVKLLIAAVGHEEAPRRVSREAQRRANELADEVAKRRQ